MRTRHLLMALALPAIFAACSQEEILVDSKAETQYKGKPLNNVSLSVSRDGDATTRMDNTGWNLTWKAGDQVGLVWTNAWEITNQLINGYDYNPEVIPGTKSWGSNTRLTCSDPANNIFKLQDGQVMEGQYFAYYPYSNVFKVNDKFGVAVDKIQNQKSALLNNPDDNLSYIKDKMVWLSRRVEETALEAKNATYIYPLLNDKAGMSKSINMAMYRFTNLLDIRFTFDKGLTAIDPANVKIESVKLAFKFINPDHASWDAKRIATTGLFDMSKLGRWNNTLDRNDEFGIPWIAADKYRLPYADNVNGLFVNNTVGKDITTIIDNPAASATGRVNFLLMPYTEPYEYLFHGQLYLTVNTNYGSIEIPESEWIKYVGSSTGMLVLGENAVLNSEYKKVSDNSDYYAGKAVNTGWANRTGAYCTRYVQVNVDNLAFTSVCVKNQQELIEAIARFNEGHPDGGTLEVCLNPTGDSFSLTDFDWSETSTDPAIAEFLTNGGILKLVPHAEDNTGKIDFNGDNTFAVGNSNILISEGFEITVVDGAKLNVNANLTIGDLITEAGSELNITAKLQTAAATLDGATNILIANAGTPQAKEGILYLTENSTNGGLMLLKGTLQFGKKITLTNKAGGQIDLCYTAKLGSDGLLTNLGKLNNEGLINYYYAAPLNKIATITNNGGQFLAEYNDGKVPYTETPNSKNINFLKEANAYGVTHYVISKASDTNTQNWDLSSAEKVTVKAKVKLVFDPSLYHNALDLLNISLYAPNALLYLENNVEFSASGPYSTYAKVRVKDIQLVFGATFTNSVDIKATGNLYGAVDANNKVKYTINNTTTGYIYGGTHNKGNLQGTITWNGNLYGVQP